MSRVSLSTILLAGVFILSARLVQAQELGVYVDAKLNSPAVKLNDVFNDWNATSTGKYAYGSLKTGAWFKFNSSISIGVEQRKYHFLDFTPETAKFYGQLESQNIPAGEYPLNLLVNSSNSNGVFIRYSSPESEQLKVRVSAYALQGHYAQIGRLTGLGNVSESGQYSYEYVLDYTYDKNELFAADSPSAKGYGHSFDLFLGYRLTENISVNLSVEDLLHRMYWNPINRDSGCLSKFATLGQSCLLNTSLMRFNQSLPESKVLSVSYSMSDYEWSILAFQQSAHKELWLEGGWNVYGAGYDKYNEAYKLTYESDHLTVKWSFDDYDLNKANNWQVMLATNWPFE